MIAAFIASLSRVWASELRWAPKGLRDRSRQGLPEDRQPGLARAVIGALGRDVVGEGERRPNDQALAEGMGRGSRVRTRPARMMP